MRPRAVAVILLSFPLLITSEPGGTLALTTFAQDVKWPLSAAGETSASVFMSAPKAVFLRLAPGASLADVMRLDPFGPFRPGMTIDEAIARHGKPLTIRSDSRKSVAVYEIPSGRIEVADQVGASTCANYHRLSVYAYPKADGVCRAKTTEVFDARVVALIPDQGLLEVATSGGDGQRVWALVREGCVEAMNWWAPPMVDD